jgi:hypothetical protein
MNETEMRELDAWIAERLFGWKPSVVSNFPGQMIPPGEPPGKELCVMGCPRYTALRAGALDVLMRCAERGRFKAEHNINIYQPADGTGRWCVAASTCDWPDEMRAEPVIAETLPLAICLFAKQLFSTEPRKDSQQL